MCSNKLPTHYYVKNEEAWDFIFFTVRAHIVYIFILYYACSVSNDMDATKTNKNTVREP